jgi:hypothetical protein
MLQRGLEILREGALKRDVGNLVGRDHNLLRLLIRELESFHDDLGLPSLTTRRGATPALLAQARVAKQDSRRKRRQRLLIALASLMVFQARSQARNR